MKKIYFSLIVVSAFYIGCGSIPSCDDKEVTQLLTEILLKQSKTLDAYDISYSSFMTNKIDKEAKKINCTNKLILKETENFSIVKEIWLDYSARYTDDGMVYVEVY